MLHVILQILAVIGIILLCILGLLLLLAGLVLFVPVRYRVKGMKDGSDISLAVRAAYLLHILTVRYDYKEPGNIIVRLFGIRIFDSEKKDTSKEEMEKTVPEQPQPTETTIGKEQAKQQNRQPETVGGQQNPAACETPGKLKKIKYTIQRICDKIKNIMQKLKSIMENISYYKEVLTDTENRLLLQRVKTRIFKVLKSIRPRVLKADLHIGTGSPDTTGYLCALYGMLLPVLGNNVSITADFEEAVWEGTVYAKGKITVFTILLQAGKIFFDKQLRIFIKQLKREES